MKRFIFILLFVLPCLLLFGQQRTIRGDLTVKGRLLELPYGTINMADQIPILTNRIGWNVRFGSVDLELSNIRHNYFWWKADTFQITNSSSKLFVLNRDLKFISTDQSYTGNYIAGNETPLEISNLKAESAKVNSNAHYIRFEPEVDDTILIQTAVGASVSIQTWTPNSSRVDVEEAKTLSLNASFDDYVKMDSLTMIAMEFVDNGIPNDSLGAYYGIYHNDHGISPATGRNYFAYSEYGDVFIGGGGEIDMFGEQLIIGSNPASGYTERADATMKLGNINAPHYTLAEENVSLLSVGNLTSTNTLHIGGGNSNFNAMTEVDFFVAANNTTTEGTEIADITIDGFEIVSGRFKQPTISASLTDGAPLDAELDSAIGDTPANVGVGASYIILDSDGTTLVYKVISNGSSWFYEALTEAL